MNEPSASAGAPAGGGAFPHLPEIKLPKGGGAIKGIGEKFTTNPVTGTASLSVPIATTTGRSDFGPELALTYDSGGGQSSFGIGWRLGLPSIARRTDKGAPRYDDATESDVFVLSGAEDLVPELIEEAGDWVRRPPEERVVDGVSYLITRYRPRIEGLFARIERWIHRDDPTEMFWRSIGRDNITTWYGRTRSSRVFDPHDPRRIFRWDICETHDDKGNLVVYEYKAEDSSGVDLAQANERNRTDASRSAQRYVKRIKYGFRTPYLPQLAPAAPPTPLPDAPLFEVVFDYGEHDDSAARPAEIRAWDVRNDPFSTYAAGFEIRTYRLCRRVLMFHHFAAEPGVGAECLVRSTDFAYRHEQAIPDPRNPIHTVLLAVEYCGFRRTGGSYTKKSLPPTEFEYSEAVLGDDVRTLDAESLRNLPAGVDGSMHRWIDLDGEGAPGVLTRQAGAWWYKRNRSALTRRVEAGVERFDARFDGLELIGAMPAAASSGPGAAEFIDVNGDGRLDLVQLGTPSGYYQRAAAPGHGESWRPFRAFPRMPNVDWENPNLRLVDLTGDGFPDVLLTENEVLTWYPSLAQDGFGPAQRTHLPTDEELGPRVVFADEAQSIFLADLSGDGLTDLVRIRNGEVSYWPNLGYGHFGAKVTMDRAPWFDTEDQFDPTRLRLGDVDGSGLTDILYLGADATRLWFNQSGNAWSTAHVLEGFPPAHSAVNVTVVDLLGTGTACLVWSTSAPGQAPRALRYLELMSAGKPHLLVRRRNNLGAETRIRYAPSTYFHQRDEEAGRPWITRLPFPVHVVERVETYDHVSRSLFVTRYAYHHGYFDGVDREFRGFGMVEQFDTEDYEALTASGASPSGDNVDAASHIPPVLTRTWFHTGVHLGRSHVSNFFAGLDGGRGEYYREPGLTAAQAAEQLLEDTHLPAGLSLEEEREACRALKGGMLRQEVYALDGSVREPHPYSVIEQNFTVRIVQPRQARNRHCVLFTHENETLTYRYEREPSDARIAHKLTLEVDASGNVLKEASVAYGRRTPDPELAAVDRACQARTFVVYTENSVTNPIDGADAHRTPSAGETRSYELTGYTGSGPDGRFRADDLLTAGALVFDAEIAYFDEPGGGRERRLLEHTRTRYRPDDLGAAAGDTLALLPLGVLEPLALTGESYKLAFDPTMLAHVYRRSVGGDPEANLIPSPPDVLAADIAGGHTADRGGYVDLDGDGRWWLPDGRNFYSPGEADMPAVELASARERFFLPHRVRNPFGATAFIRYDPYHLLLEETRDAAGNVVTVGERDTAGNLVSSGNDYRVLQPALTMDANRNRTAVAYDTLGLVVGTAVMGKPEEALGDSLAGFNVDLDEATVLQHLNHPLANPHAILGGATNRLVYDLFAYSRTREDPQPQPAVVYMIARETHVSDLPPGEPSLLQHGFTYSDGFERVVQNKVLAEPGAGPLRDADGEIVPGEDGRPQTAPMPADPRWVGSGWKIFNNKGKPVREYEQFFTDVHRFEADQRIGVSPVLFYDPLARLVAMLHADHTFNKVIFGAWREQRWDVNDTVMIANPANDPDVGDHFARLPATEYLPTWRSQRIAGALGPDEQAAAEKATVHAGTPTTAHADSLGRSFLTVVHNRYRYSDAPGGSAPIEEFFATRVHVDLEGRPREVLDARDRVVERYDYDRLGALVHQTSMEAGERWSLKDVSGNVIRSWDSRGQSFRIAYDELRRPAQTFLRPHGAAELMVERTRYGEELPAPEARNARGRVAELSDQAGFVTHDAYDFKGNLLESHRRLAVEYESTLDWSAPVPLESQSFTSRTGYDALNRAVRLDAPDGSVVQPRYNEANLLQSLDVSVRGAAFTPFVANVDYDAKGRRARIDYGNGASTLYEYDPTTLRLARLTTARGSAAFPADCPEPPVPGSPGCGLQDLRYTYDPVGNITRIRDHAQQAIFFRNQRVEPSSSYSYDALYRLIDATGREHLGQLGGAPTAPQAPSALSALHTRIVQPGDGNAMGRYFERCTYDPVGNLLELLHRGSDPAHAGWTRAYFYDEPSQIDAAVNGNRLTSTTVSGVTETYRYDGLDGAHGGITGMSHLPLMRWNYRDQLQASARQVVNGGGAPETTYYVYDSSGQRVRKVTERQAAAGQAPTRLHERVYLGGFELYRRYGGDGLTVTLERETLHVMDDRQRVALIETRTAGDDGSPQRTIRYQIANHTASSALELDENAHVLSYEEYSPFGVTTYQAVRAQTDPPKRYRYTAMERDEESGLSYHGQRYYAPWLGRWTSADPIGLKDGVNGFAYCANNPINRVDIKGTNGEPTPLNYANFEEYVEARNEHAQATLPAEWMQQEWDDALANEEASRVSVSDETAAARAAVEQQFHRDLRQLQQIRTPALAFIMPSHIRPYLRDQTAGIRDPYLRFIGGINQRGGLAVAQFTNRLASLTVIAWGAGMVVAAGAAVVVGEGIGMGALVAGGSRLVSAYRSASLFITTNYARIMAASTAAGAASRSPTVQSAMQNVWRLNPFARGRAIEQTLTRILQGTPMRASNFPTIDMWVRSANNMASRITSIKSIDLALRSYQRGNAVFSRLSQYLTSLANFTGRTWGGETVRVGAQTVRVLEVAIPPNVATASQLAQLQQAAALAQRLGIQLNIRVVQ